MIFLEIDFDFDFEDERSKDHWRQLVNSEYSIGDTVKAHEVF